MLLPVAVSVSQEENGKLDTPWHYLIKHSGWWLVDRKNPHPSPQSCPTSQLRLRMKEMDPTFAGGLHGKTPSLSNCAVCGCGSGRKTDVYARDGSESLFFVWNVIRGIAIRGRRQARKGKERKLGFFLRMRICWNRPPEECLNLGQSFPVIFFFALSQVVYWLC